MHIPNSMLHGAICPVTALISALGIGIAAFKAFSAKHKPTAAKFAAITALIFAGQMMNFPISGGTSGHLLGGVIAVSLLGIPFGILSLALVVTIQCLVFSDGGFTVLGANILNMAIIGAGAAGGILVAFLIFKTDIWQLNNFAAGYQTLALAHSKVNIPFMTGLYSGICGNWLICSGIMMALAARTVSGKILALVFPITISFALGFENCVANMYIVPMGMFLKTTSLAASSRLKLGNLTALGFLNRNLIPVTLGNIIGGAGLVAGVHWLADRGK